MSHAHYWYFHYEEFDNLPEFAIYVELLRNADHVFEVKYVIDVSNNSYLVTFFVENSNPYPVRT